MRRVKLLGCSLDVATMQETTAQIDAAIQKGSFLQHTVVNVAKLVHMRSDPRLRSAVESCDIINIDGMGVVWGGRFLGLDIPSRVAGIDLFQELIALSAMRGYGVFLLGARDEIVHRAAQVLKQSHGDLVISGIHHGYFWDNEEEIVGLIEQSGAKLLFVAITSPLKETFIDKWRDRLGVSFVMGVGGTFDVVAGKVSRAPLFMQRWGMEWLYRLLQEPGRMWKRYLTTNVLFGCLLVRERFRPGRAKE
jgi:N-acetylglucosaminyldiphosphoundecaprenol N-acetyl-beta-D-mannosaminyltransferase